MNFSTASRVNQVAVETLDSARRDNTGVPHNLNNQSLANANHPYQG